MQLVIGPAQVSKRTKPLQELGNAALSSGGNIGPVKQLGRLGRSLKVAAGGVDQLRGGISEASAGAGLLAQGSDRAGEGAQLIANGLGRATGRQRAGDDGARQIRQRRQAALAEAQETAAVGGLQLKLGARDLGGRQPAHQRAQPLAQSGKVARRRSANTTLPRLLGPAKVADEQLKAALAQLQGMTVGKTDPNYGADRWKPSAAPAPRSVAPTRSAALPTPPATQACRPNWKRCRRSCSRTSKNPSKVTAWLQSTLINLKKLANAAGRLSEGLYEIQAGGKKLAGGAARLDRAARSLGGGLTRLSGGAVALVGGIDRLSGGAEALEAGLAEAVDRSAPLQSGLSRASVRVIAGKARIKHQVRRVRRATPGLFNSGYFVLSAARRRQPAGARSGGRHDRPRQRPGGVDDGDLQVLLQHARLDRAQQAPRRRKRGEFSDEAGLATGVAGGVAQVNEFSQRHPRPDPLHHRRDHAGHLPGPDRRPALDPAGGDRGRRSTSAPSPSPSAS